MVLLALKMDTYLVPWLVGAGYEVFCVTRGEREPYQPPRGMVPRVWRVRSDRKAEEVAGAFGQHILDLWDQIAHSPNCSIAKVRRLLGYYQPRYSSLQAVREAVT